MTYTHENTVRRRSAGQRRRWSWEPPQLRPAPATGAAAAGTLESTGKKDAATATSAPGKPRLHRAMLARTSRCQISAPDHHHPAGVVLTQPAPASSRGSRRCARTPRMPVSLRCRQEDHLPAITHLRPGQGPSSRNCANVAAVPVSVHGQDIVKG